MSKPMPADTTLAPCPFCGAAAHFESDKEGWHWVECESCGMQGNRGASLMEDCLPKLCEAWNRRTPQAPLTPERIDELAQTAFMDYMADRNDDSDLAFARAIEAEHGIR